MLLATAAIAAAQPAINAGGILNTSSYLPRLAPATVFVIFGRAMGPGALVAAPAPNYPLTLSGTSITFTPAAGGTAIDAKMIYTVGGQVGGLLPSSIAPGTYAVRVTYNGQPSAPQNVLVVARHFGIASANSAGYGLAQSTIGNINAGLSLTRFTTGATQFNGLDWVLSPAHPGDTVVLWGTGGGADAKNDTGGTSGDQTAQGNFRVNVSGRLLTPIYAGASSGYPGLWQVNFALPADITLDCFASVQVVTGSEAGNAVILPIAAAGQSACSDPQVGLGELKKLDGGVDVIEGAFAMARLGSTPNSTATDTVGGAFFRFTADQWIRVNTGPKYDRCVINDRTYPLGTSEPGRPSAALDAGARLAFTGSGVPSGVGLNLLATALGPFYSYSPSTNIWLGGSAYAINGTGGGLIGAFSAAVTFPSAFDATNWNSITTIERTQPLTFTWTGTGFAQVYIQVTTNTTIDRIQHTVTLNCYVPAAQGSYSISPAALAALQPAATTGSSFGSIALEAFVPTLFQAPLPGGGQTDRAVFAADLGVSKNVAVK